MPHLFPSARHGRGLGVGGIEESSLERKGNSSGTRPHPLQASMPKAALSWGGGNLKSNQLEVITSLDWKIYSYNEILLEIEGPKKAMGLA